MENNIKATIQPIKKILCDEDKLYQIPNYQRPYSWDKDQLSALIEDLVEFYTEDNQKEYFIGSLVLVNNGERYDVIDGQQRLTTFIIMACVFKYSDSYELSGQQKDWIDESIQRKHLEGDQGIRLKFLTADDSQNKFEQTVLRGITDKKDNKNRYLKNAHFLKEYIEKKIKDEGVDVNKFIKWFYEKATLTEIICFNEDRAIQIFNVLNDRGLPLSPVDILKSRLMQGIKDEESKNSFVENWKKIVQKLEDSDLGITDMLITYQHYQNPETSQKRLDKTLLESFKRDKKDALEVVYEMECFCDKYIICLTAEDKYIYCLKYTRNSYWVDILTTAYYKDYEYIEELKKLLLAYYYQSWIAGGTAARVKGTSFSVLRSIKNGESIKEIKKKLEGNLMEYPPSYKDVIGSDKAAEKKWIKPVLFLVEYFLDDDSKINFIENDKKIDLEHILPQNPAKGKWGNFSDEEKDEWTHSLANLSLLSKKKNVQARNYDFKEKKLTYEEKDDVRSSFKITQKICEFEEWNVESLENRKQFLLKRIHQRLDLFDN